MKAEELLKKLNKLDSIYTMISVSIEVYCNSVDDAIIENWKSRKKKLKLNLVNQFKKEACFDIAHCAWVQSIRKTLEPKTEKGFSAWIENYLKNK